MFMARIRVRTDSPASLIRTIRTAPPGDTVVIEVPVQVSGQESRAIAYSIFDAIFICEALASSFEGPRVSFTESAEPGVDLVLLEGTLIGPAGIVDFVNEWRGKLDPNGDGEPFWAADAAVQLFDRLESDESDGAFRFPELVRWFREVRIDFDDWDADVETSEE